MKLRRLTGRALSILAVGILVAHATVPATAQNAADPQAALADLLLADGTTRGQAAKGLVGALQVAGFQPPDCVPGEELFDDVPAGSPFCPFVEALARAGITGGCDGDNFCPGKPVTRQQMAVFVIRTLEATRATSAYTASDDEVLLDIGFDPVLSTSIDVPSGGRMVMATATLDAVSADPNGAANCRIVIGGSIGQRQVTRNGDNIRQNLALTHAAPLDGGSHPVVLECSQGGLGQTVEVQKRTLSVLAAAPAPPTPV